jgi:hypothetical protein
VLTINPNNDRAKQGLQMLTQKSASAPTKSAAAQADDVLASTSFTSTPVPGPNPFGDDDEDELPSSLLDAPAAPPPAQPASAPPTASSSASSNFHVDEPSSEDYDAWMSNLNLGGAKDEDPFQSDAMGDAAAAFISTNIDDDEDADLFNAATSAAVFGDDDDDDLFSSGPFSATDTAPPLSNTPPPRPAAAAFTSKSSGLTAQRSPDSLLDEIEDDDVLSSDFDQDELDKLDASEFFQYIPRDIQATRLPGTREGYPPMVIVGFLALILLNVGAVALLVTNLTAK